MIPLLLSLAGIVVASLLLLAALPLAQALAASGPGARTVHPRLMRPRLAILMPAHDEALGIGATLAALMPQLNADDRLVVVADNCTDETAQIAAAAGATVLERVDRTLRGKGYALAHGLDALRHDPPEVVLMFDADCVAAPDCVQRLAAAAARTRRPVQALYLLRAVGRGLAARLSEFAFRLRNHVRPLGMARLGQSCQLMGSGMAFHWSLLEDVSLASGHLTEDLQLGVLLARRGSPPLFVPDAVVHSRLAGDAKSATAQRTRWVHGHLGIMTSELPRLVASGFRRRDLRLLMMAWDLAIPPFALFVPMVVASVLLFAAIWLAGGPTWPLIAAVTALGMTTMTMVVAQRGFARDLIALHEIFMTAPLYVAGKLPAYLRFVFRRQVEWVRTRRDAR